MNYKIKLSVIALMLSNFFSIKAQDIPKDYFSKPLEIPILLSGTFGELRSNHFHAGLDIKTKGRVGFPVKASAEGYIGRIKVQHFGYGKALYVYHPNGYQTVYAHLNEFNDEIEAFVKKQQYKKESYEIELFPGENELKVTQEDIIAFSGNSGSSGGPHLHFEIRDHKSRPMNPFLFGFEDVQDTKAPRIVRLHAYPLSKDAHVNNKNQRQQIRLVQQDDGDYISETIEAFGKIGFGIDAYDQFDLSYNKNGIYAVETKLNGNLIFETTFNKFSFYESRYINRMIDFEYLKVNKRKIQKLFIEPNNPLSVYENVVDDGILNLNKDSINHKVDIEIRDFKNNVRKITIPIKTKFSESIESLDTIKETTYFAKANEASAFEEGKVDIYIPKGALYDDTYLDIDFEGLSVDFDHYTRPLHKSVTIGFDVSEFNDEDKSQLYIARVFPWGTKYYVSTYKQRERFTTKVNQFGKYELHSDTVPPTIKPKNFTDKKWMSNYRYLELEIDDEDTGIDSYRATVNGKFILMEYDYKTKTLTHDFNDGVVSDTKNKLKVVVTDKVGNTAIFEAEFFRKNK